MAKKVQLSIDEFLQHNLQEMLNREFGKRTIDNMELPEYFTTSLNPMMCLRPYQEECFRYFLTYWNNDFVGKERQPHLLFHMATGSGKTLIMAGLMLFLYEQGYKNFLFFVNSGNVIEKTKDNFLNTASAKYQFGSFINIGTKKVEVRLVDNFQSIDEDSINICLTTIQGLHSDLNTPKENSLTYEDFIGKKIVLISDEAHHINVATKKGKLQAESEKQIPLFQDSEFESSDDWETTVMRIFKSNNGTNMPNLLLEFTATEDFTNANIADKYKNKVIFDYPLKKFREDGYSKDITLVQSDLPPIDRAVQTVVLSQYKRKLFSLIHQDIKPIIMLKSKTIAANKVFFDEFVRTIRHLNIENLQRIKSHAKNDVLDAFTYFDELGITLENFLLEIKDDFKEDNLLLVDGNNISLDIQSKLNSLEAKDNEYRAIFAVDMLNEGWDVLNLYDIVRLYDTRDANSNMPGKTTNQEAQLIGRGARYMPFQAPGVDKPKGERKFDKDLGNRLRALETLHYHSSHNSKYIQELKTALKNTGIIASSSYIIEEKLKDSFKQTRLYKNGVVFLNKQESYLLNERITSIGETILTRTFKTSIKSGEMKSSLVFSKTTIEESSSLKYITLSLGEFGKHILRAALNKFENFKFSALKKIFPNLASIKEFIESDQYLSKIQVNVYGRGEMLNNLSQKEKLGCVVDVLRQIEPLLSKGGKGYRGTRRFEPWGFKEIFKDHKLSIALSESDDREYGCSMKESTNVYLRMDLTDVEWHAYNDNFGTSEEKYLVKYIESVYPSLQQKYDEIYLVRNEKDLKIYSFSTGEAFEPDYVLFMRRKGVNVAYDNLQIFIEPKGEHLRKKDAWKEDCLREIHNNAIITFQTGSNEFEIWGLPFFTESCKSEFDKAVTEVFNH